MYIKIVWSKWIAFSFNDKCFSSRGAYLRKQGCDVNLCSNQFAEWLKSKHVFSPVIGLFHFLMAFKKKSSSISLSEQKMIKKKISFE